VVASKTMKSPVHSLAFAVMATAIASLTAGSSGGGVGLTPQQACDALDGAPIEASRIAPSAYFVREATPNGQNRRPEGQARNAAEGGGVEREG
ncbi:MAG: hypothetical protein ACREMY_08295, partial [bacterium]